VQPQGARVVTPEAVVLEVRTAGLGSRAFARVIDGLIQGAALVVVFIFTGALAASSGDGAVGTAGVVIDLVVITLILFGYPVIWEWLWRGRTPGKAALGLRVVTRQGAPIRFRHALVRGVLGLVEVMALPVIGVIALLASTNDQRLGDMSAGTIVIRERAAGPMSVPVTFYPPPGWESFVASLDVSGITAGEYENLRSFLIRAHQMAPLSRSSLAARLATPLVSRLHQSVPVGAGPELWLACVACAYQRRHGAPAPFPAPAPAGWSPRAPGPSQTPAAWPAPAPAGWSPPPPPPAPAGWSPPPPPPAPAGWSPPPRAAPTPPARRNDGFSPPD
jgi:uncharacterized RDD family membrane protein YckC